MCHTSTCKKLHAFVKFSIKITLGRPNHPKCKPNVPFFLVKMYSWRKWMKGFSLTLFPESYSDVRIYIIREIMISNVIEVTIVSYILLIITSLIIHSAKTSILYKNKVANDAKVFSKVKLIFLLIWLLYLNFKTYRGNTTFCFSHD